MVYIDTNMVRAGVVGHPSQWSFCGYSEIQEPRRKNVLIDYERLEGSFGAASYDQLRETHKEWVTDYLEGGLKTRKEEWTRSFRCGEPAFCREGERPLRL